MAGLPEVQRVDAGEGVQVDVVADARVGFAQLHRGAEFLGTDRGDGVAADFDGWPVEQSGQADGAGPGCDGVAEVDVEFEFDSGGGQGAVHRESNPQVHVTPADGGRGGRGRVETHAIGEVDGGDVVDKADDGVVIVGDVHGEQV